MLVRVMFGVVAAAGIGGAIPVRADALLMPFACRADGGALALERAAPQRYEIAGPRAEQAITVCATPGQSRCQTFMVHRFRMNCGAATVEWADVAAAAGRIGASLPQGLPAGYAPIGALGACLVFEPLATFKTPPADAGHVERETLSDESVRGLTDDPAGHDLPAAWATTVTADIASGQSGTLVRIGLVLAALMAVIFGAGLMMAHGSRDGVAERDALRRLFAAVNGWLAALTVHRARGATPDGLDPVSIANATAVAIARLAETELTVAALPRTLLLREVLQGEVEQVRKRLAQITNGKDKFPLQGTAARLRTILRDLERIARIADGAAKDTRDSRTADTAGPPRMPASVQEAYQILGINVDAAPAVAKKLVDALRMSWHPDHARDETDRQTREARMKQINAAWDLVKSRYAQAA